MLVRDILRTKGRDVITTTPGTYITVAMAALIRNKISCLPVMDDDGSLIGIISDKDIFRFIYEEPKRFQEHTVADLMSSKLIVGIEEDRVEYIAGLMTHNRIRHIPIVCGERLVGLISIGDVVKGRMKDMEVENRYLHQFINGQYPA